MRLPVSRNKIAPFGFIYLIDSYKDAGQVPPLTFPPGEGFNNPYMDGFLIREFHALIEPTQGVRDWTWLENAVSACEGVGKLAAMQNLAGSASPNWVYSPTFPDGGCYSMEYGGGHVQLPVTTVCWDPVWQGIWRSLNVEMASHFDGRLAYIVDSGIGSGSESFLIQNPDFMPNAERAASAFGYPNAITAWLAGTQWIIDMMSEVWPNTPQVLTTGNPFPPGLTTPDSTVALQSMYTYGNTTYRGRFACRPNNLTHGSPNPIEPSVQYLGTTSHFCIASGFQYGNNQIKPDHLDPDWLDQAIVRGNGYNAHFQEFFPADADASATRPEVAAVFAARRPEVPGIPS